MQSDTPSPDDRRDLEGRAIERRLENGVAAIIPVTDAALDHAAHEAAALADGVAQGTVVLDRAAAGVEDAARNAAEASDGVAEVMVEIAVEALDGAGRAAERGADAASNATSASADALAQYNAKVVEMVRSNLAATTALFAALIQAKSMPEALSLNAEHLRRQMEALTSHGRELATLAQRIALDAMQPFKGGADR